MLNRKENHWQNELQDDVAQEDVYDPRTDELIIEAGDIITEEIAEKIEDASIESVYIRTVLNLRIKTWCMC